MVFFQITSDGTHLKIIHRGGDGKVEEMGEGEGVGIEIGM